MRKIVILANGAMPTGEEALRILRGTCSMTALVCCDGAYSKAKALGCEPDLVVGDGDSLSGEEKHILGRRLRIVSEQETNDLAKAFYASVDEYGLNSNDRVVILGASGLREDHLIGNVYRLIEFAVKIPLVEVVTDYGRFTVVSETRKYETVLGAAVSVFSPYYDAKVVSDGLEWPLKGIDLAMPWSGTLNRTTNTSFTLSSTKPVIVYEAF